MEDGSRSIAIRPMLQDDVSAVAAIELLTNPSPWSPEQFQAELNNPASRFDLLFVDGNLAAFICVWSIVDELQIQNVATAPGFRRMGNAKKLLESVLHRAKHENVNKVFLEVRIGNTAARALYEKFGFTDSGVRRNYYADNEDALLIELSLHN